MSQLKFELNFNASDHSGDELVIISAFQKKVATKKKGKEDAVLVNSHWHKECRADFESLKASAHFTGAKGDTFCFAHGSVTMMAVGLGEKSKFSHEDLRQVSANVYKAISNKYKSASVSLDHFKKGDLETTIQSLVEGYGLASYVFDAHLSKKKTSKLKEITFDSKEKKTKLKKAEAALSNAKDVVESICYARDLVNEPPNVLNSETYAKRVVADAKKIKGVKTKVLGKSDLKKLKMGLFLSVNAGSAYEPQLVHLTYTPAKANSKTKHIALVGKGLTFDTGGYSLKPSTAMVNMKFDMAGSATVYGAFRAAAMLGLNVKISCFLGMTDNAVNSKATMPDSICVARNGKSVEILNTDAEGRLVLADCLTYASEQKPDAIIDAATLTGAVLVSLGHEVCGVMGTDQKLADKLLKSGKATDEYIWQLPIIKEFYEDLKSPVADLKNIGGSRFGGSSKAAAFLSEFVGEGIPWAHLDIAGIGDSQGHRAYCPNKGASGLVIRSLVHFLKNV